MAGRNCRNWRRFHSDPLDDEREKEYRKADSSNREDWLDQGHGSFVFCKSQRPDDVAEALRHCDHRATISIQFVGMPNHVHALVQRCRSLPERHFALVEKLQRPTN